MNNQSVFCDVGSGMGRILFMSAILCDVKSVGIEIV